MNKEKKIKIIGSFMINMSPRNVWQVKMTDSFDILLGDVKSSPNACQTRISSKVTLWFSCLLNNTDNWDTYVAACMHS